MILPGMVGIIGGVSATGAAPGAIPTFVAAGTISGSNAGGANFTPGLPVGTAENDIMLLLTECMVADTVPEPSDFDEVPNSPQSDATATETKLQVFWSRAGAVPAAPVVTRVGDHTCGVLLSFSGCTLTGSPVNITAGNAGSGTAVSINGLTTTVVNCLIVDCLSHGTDSAVGNRFTGWTNADLASPGIAEAVDVGSAAGGGGGLAAAYGGRAASGAVSATTVTFSLNQSTGRIKVALKPLNT